MIPRIRTRHLLLTLFACLLCAALPAATYMPMSDADLIRLAPMIVRAEVLNQSVRLDRVGSDDLPFTIVTLRVLESFKGASTEETIQVRLPGGVSGERIWWIPGTPSFEPGQEVVLMLDAIADGSGDHRLTEFGLSKFNLVPDESGRGFAVRSVFSTQADLQVSRVEPALGALASGDPRQVPSRDAESFLSALRTLRRGEDLPQIGYAVPAGDFLRKKSDGLRAEWANIGGIEPAGQVLWFFQADSPTATVVINGTQSNLGSDDSCGTDSSCYVKNAVTGWHGIANTDVHVEGPDSTGVFTVNLDAATDFGGGSAWTTPFPCEGGVLGLGGPQGTGHNGGFRGDSPAFAAQTGTVSMRRSGCTTAKYSGKVFKTAVMHEIGHVLGLNHPDQFTSIHSSTPSASWLSAIMTSSVPSSRPSTPQTDDIQAMQYYYGTAALGPAPVANFSFSPANPVAGAPVAFTDSSTNSPTGYSWYFGDSSPLTAGANPSHTFASAGSYPVQLYAGNLNGTGKITKTVSVGTGGGPSTCSTADGMTLCLSEGRFRVAADFQKLNDITRHAHAVTLTPNTGYFWFFDETNVEVVTKVLNSCASSFNSIWVFAAGLTNVKVDVTYLDTKTNTTVIKSNPQSTAFVAIQDTQAFKTCP